jgi:hypothetical protein
VREEFNLLELGRVYLQGRMGAAESVDIQWFWGE